MMKNAFAKIPGYSNPLISHKYGADPYAIVFDGRVYVYMTNDTLVYDEHGKVTQVDYGIINKISVISSEDMVNWTDHGEVPVAGPNGIAKWAKNSWAPAVAHKNIEGKDKFFLYFANNGSGIGVLVGDTPTGPWSDPLGEVMIGSNTPGIEGVWWLFDPAVLVDDDGTGYLYCGGGIPHDPNCTPEEIANPKTSRVLKLAEDMIHIDGSAVTIDAPYMFEDSGIHKYKDKYYYSYCTNFSGVHPKGAPPKGEIAYMVSDNPMGPFTYVETILKNPSDYFGVGGNNHHAIFEFKNQWYITYHAQTLDEAIAGEGRGYRSTHINKLEYYENGLIKEVKADMEGVAQITKLNPFLRNGAETFAWNFGISTEKAEAPGNLAEGINLNVTGISDGDWIAVSKADFGENGATAFKANVAASLGGKIEIHLDQYEGELIGELIINPTGGEQSRTLMSIDIKKVTGVHDIYFVFKGKEEHNNLFNIDYWQFS